MLPAGFEPAIPASARPQTYALDRTLTGTDIEAQYVTKKEETKNLKCEQKKV
jgi:hypothetical protein